MTQVRRRGTGLFSIVAVAIVLMACGRATDQQIDQALGITPTATVDATAEADRAATTEAELALAESSPASGGDTDAVALGNPVQGSSRYQFVCLMCHTAGGGGAAPDLLASGGPGATLTLEALTVVIREGTGHPPGPYAEFQVTDSDIANILAYILQESAP
ncbi:MAG: cytochrome c [Thermomicrobiales bacterium]